MAGQHRIWIGAILSLVVFSSTGCNMLPHELQPHRLWRWNRQPAPSNDAYFSIDDKLTTEPTAETADLGDEASFDDASLDDHAFDDDVDFGETVSQLDASDSANGFGHTVDYSESTEDHADEADFR